MILDVNVLLAARNLRDARHERARRWLEDRLNGDTRVGLPWTTLAGFLRIAVNPRVFPDALSPDAAWEQIEKWLAAPRAWIPEPSARFPTIVGALVRRYRPTSAVVPDVLLAALAIDHGVAVASADTDFARFSEIVWLNPLAPS